MDAAIIDGQEQPARIKDHINKLAMGLEVQIVKVRELRATSSDLQTEIRERKAAWETENESLLTRAAAYQKTLGDEEARLRELTLSAYHQTGEKKPVKGVGIRITKGLQYDENSIKQWAINEGHIMFLALDRAGFEGWAKAMMKSSKLPDSLHESGAAVMETTSPSATIAKEL